MFTIIFVILKLTGVIHVSWWWIILVLLIDEEVSVGKVRKKRAYDLHQNLPGNLQEDYDEEDIGEILEEHGDYISQEDLQEELRDRY